jgi:hypothetical protein
VPFDLQLDFPPIKCRPSLQSLPNELLAGIFSYLIPAEICVKKIKILCNNGSKQQHIFTTHPKPNPLNFMATSSLFYHIARQHPTLKYRTYSARITTETIEFEGHTCRALERLQGAIPHIHDLRLVFHIGSWGFATEGNPLNRFIRNFEQFSRAFDGPSTNRRRVIGDVYMGGEVPYPWGGRPVLPARLQIFLRRCTRALWSGGEPDLGKVLGFLEPEAVVDGEGSNAQEDGVVGFVRSVLNGDTADALRVMASFLYKVVTGFPYWI